MTWLTWRQHRMEMIVGLIVVSFLGLFLYATGGFLYRMAASSSPYVIGGQVGLLQKPLLYPILVLPLLLGVFVGAPLVAREYEQGTARLVWTQGITRRRWFYSKVLLLCSATLILFGALALGLVWWNRPVTPILGPWLLFDNNGFVLVAQAFFGLALGVALSALIGKTVPAMGLTMVLFVAVRLALVLLRPHYLPPEQVLWDTAGDAPHPPHILVTDMRLVDRDGRELSSTDVARACPQVLVVNPADGVDSLNSCYTDHGYRQALSYQPPERFWPLQGIESGIFLLLSAGLLVVAERSLRARLGGFSRE